MAKMIEGLIAVMLGAILLFAVVIPILNNASLGTLYEGEAITNATADDTGTILQVSCMPIRSDVTYVLAENATGDSLTSKITVYDAVLGKFKYTNTTVLQEDVITFSEYRCLDSAYVTDDTARTVTGFLPLITIVLLLVGITSMLYMRAD